MSEFQAGAYEGTIHNATLDQVGENNTLLVKIFFNIQGVGTYPWSGWFSDKVNEKTGKTYSQLVVEQLVRFGFTGSDIADIVDGKAQDLFNCNKVWSCDVDFQTDRDGKITKYKEVKWVNDPEKQYTSKLDKAQAVQATSGLKGLLAQAQKDMPADDIPF